MAEKCPICSGKVGGILGLTAPSIDLINFAKKADIYKDGMCLNCLNAALAQHKGREEEKKRDILFQQKAVQSLSQEPSTSPVLENALKKLFITPASNFNNDSDLGLITGYCIMGTGPISAIMSSWTDFLGKKSNAYLEKIRNAEAFALAMLGVEAFKKGGDAVYCCRVTLTEATSGHGMLMVSASGSAVKTGKADKDIEEAWKLFSSLK